MAVVERLHDLLVDAVRVRVEERGHRPVLIDDVALAPVGRRDAGGEPRQGDAGGHHVGGRRAGLGRRHDGDGVEAVVGRDETEHARREPVGLTLAGRELRDRVQQREVVVLGLEGLRPRCDLRFEVFVERLELTERGARH
jgi:hypothetical protein